MNADRLVQLFVVIALLSIAGASASAQLFNPSMSDLSSYGFPSSMGTSSIYDMPTFTQLSSIPFTSSDPTSAIASIAMQQLASPMSWFTSLMPGTGNMFGNQASTGSLFGFPMMSGIGTISPSDSTSQIPISNLGFTGPQFSSMLPGIDNSALSPSTVNSYTEASNGQTIKMKVGDIIHVQLSSRLDQGFVWNLTTTGGLNITANRMYSPQEVNTNLLAGVIGIQATEEWTIKAVQPGTQKVTGVCTRSDGAKPGDKTFVLAVIVE